jgi:hypothetical protein
MTTDDAIKKLEVYKVESGDIIVVECAGKLAQENMEQLLSNVKLIFSDLPVRVLILDNGASIKVVRHDQEIKPGNESGN